MDRNDNNNIAVVAGLIESEPVFSHEVYGEKFYTFSVMVKRISDVYDKINIVFPERLCPVKNICKGDNYRISGQFRSHNNPTPSGNRLLLNLFAKDAELIIEKDIIYENSAHLTGYICKPVTYRKTPLGREIADILLAVNRSFNKSDYLPCIAWGRNAKYTGIINVGTKVLVEGRIQSRIYTKNLGENEVEKIAYEISVNNIQILE